MIKLVLARKLPGLPDMPKTLSGVHRWAKKNGLARYENKGQGGGFQYNFYDLPILAQRALTVEDIDLFQEPENVPASVAKNSKPQPIDHDYQISTFEESPDFARRKAEKYLVIITATEGMIGQELKDWLEKWNTENLDQKTSYPMVLRMRKQYAEGGVAALLGQWGRKKGVTKIEDAWFETFKSLYLRESRPSLASCWAMTLGAAIQEKPSLNTRDFPCQTSFYRLLMDRLPEDVIYCARYGQSAWYRKHASYVERDYSNIAAGEVWVSDHAQIDILVRDGERHKAPWLTAWRDAKSGKFLGYCLHIEPPSSDHIFEAFFVAAVNYGLPKHVLIDNGKDYRCKDFAGGREIVTRHKVACSEVAATPMLMNLGVRPHFALPYNAQTKPIERDFLKFKTWFSKRFPGYRGGDVVERPEGLQAKVRGGQLMEYSELKELLAVFIDEIFNNMPSQGKVLKGRTPNQLWAEEFRNKREVRRDALKLFCMRSSTTCSIRRNGLYDSKYEVTYEAEWMNGYRGTKVYWRRAPDKMQEIWVFDAENNAYIGSAYMKESIDFLAETDVQKSKLQEQMAQKRRDERRVKEELKKIQEVEPAVQLQWLKTGTDARHNTAVPVQQTAPVVQIVNSNMDQAVIQRKQIEERENYGLQGLTPAKPRKPTPIFHNHTDKELWEKQNRRNEDE
jgi:hypothetical protein